MGNTVRSTCSSQAQPAPVGSMSLSQNPIDLAVREASADLDAADASLRRAAELMKGRRAASDGGAK